MNTPRPLPFLQNSYNSKLKQSPRKYAVYKHTFSMEKQKENFGRRCKEKMMITKMRRNTRALSPIFAVLILIAIAVIAGIVVYMFTSGTIASLTGGGTAGQEKAAVQGVDVALDTVYAQNTGGVTIEVSDYIIKNAGGTIVASGTAGGVTTLDVNGGLAGITCGGEISALATSNPGESFTVTLVSTKGGSFVSSSFVP
jgi:flagellin-like protein